MNELTKKTGADIPIEGNTKVINGGRRKALGIFSRATATAVSPGGIESITSVVASEVTASVMKSALTQGGGFEAIEQLPQNDPKLSPHQNLLNGQINKIVYLHNLLLDPFITIKEGKLEEVDNFKKNHRAIYSLFEELNGLDDSIIGDDIKAQLSEITEIDLLTEIGTLSIAWNDLDFSNLPPGIVDVLVDFAPSKYLKVLIDKYGEKINTLSTLRYHTDYIDIGTKNFNGIELIVALERFEHPGNQKEILLELASQDCWLSIFDYEDLLATVLDIVDQNNSLDGENTQDLLSSIIEKEYLYDRGEGSEDTEANRLKFLFHFCHKKKIYTKAFESKYPKLTKIIRGYLPSESYLDRQLNETNKRELLQYIESI